MEDTNLRLFNGDVSSTVLNFRCGNNALVRVNYAQTVHFYNDSFSAHNLTESKDVKWMRVRFADQGGHWH